MLPKHPECFSLDLTFRFDQPSDKLQEIKSALMRGNTLEITVVDDIRDGTIVGEFFVLFFQESFHEIMQRAREHARTGIEIVEHQCITMLGSNSAIASKIHAVLDASATVYLIPEQYTSSKILGNYTVLFVTPN